MRRARRSRFLRTSAFRTRRMSRSPEPLVSGPPYTACRLHSSGPAYRPKCMLCRTTCTARAHICTTRCSVRVRPLGRVRVRDFRRMHSCCKASRGVAPGRMLPRRKTTSSRTRTTPPTLVTTPTPTTAPTPTRWSYRIRTRIPTLSSIPIRACCRTRARRRLRHRAALCACTSTGCTRSRACARSMLATTAASAKPRSVPLRARTRATLTPRLAVQRCPPSVCALHEARAHVRVRPARGPAGAAPAPCRRGRGRRVCLPG
jgi:hypothetical protein